MAAYEPTMSYRLIYIFAIHDKDHEGYLKIGDTTFDSTKSYDSRCPARGLLEDRKDKF